MMLASSASNSTTQITPPETLIDADGGTFAATNFDVPQIKPANANDPTAGVYSTLSNTEQATADLSGLSPNDQYKISGSIYAFQHGHSFQFAVLDGSTSLGAKVMSTTDPFELIFDTPDNTDNLTLHLSGTGGQVGITNFIIELVPERRIPITGSGGDRADGEAPVNMPELAYDGNPSTYARFDNASWQQHSYYFEMVNVTRIVVRSHTYEGSAPEITCGGKTFTPSTALETQEFIVNENIDRISIYDDISARTRIYEIEVYGR